jgi:hypothetical protein
LKTLVLGGYGNFGARICRALAGDPTVELVVGGRDESRATALARALGSGAIGMPIDWAARDFAEVLHRLGVELLIHAAGPFQGQDYSVARAAARVGAHYIDLADGRRFVCDFPAALDADFRSAGRTAISGASTVPALSSAVVKQLARGWRSIHHISTCIAPAQTAPRGSATLAAVLGYCGTEIRVWQKGQWQSRRAWAEPELVHFARMPRRLGALCDIPDLEIFPAHFGVRDDVFFRAALEISLAQRAFAALASARAMGVVRRPERLARPLNAVATWFDGLGSSRGGMVVRVAGEDDAGQDLRGEWHITADNDHGPEIPCMASILLARRLARGEVLPVGAEICVGLLELEDFLPEFSRWGMHTDILVDATGHGARAV